MAGNGEARQRWALLLPDTKCAIQLSAVCVLAGRLKVATDLSSVRAEQNPGQSSMVCRHAAGWLACKLACIAQIMYACSFELAEGDSTTHLGRCLSVAARVGCSQAPQAALLRRRHCCPWLPDRCLPGCMHSCHDPSLLQVGGSVSCGGQRERHCGLRGWACGLVLRVARCSVVPMGAMPLWPEAP